MGLLGSRGRGANTSTGGDRKSRSNRSGSHPSDDRGQSWSKIPVVGSAVSESDRDERSRERESAPGRRTGAQGGKLMATVGQSIVFKGELTGDEDLEIEGQVDGIIQLANHQLTIGEYAPRKIKIAVTGNGNATKEQVQLMVQRILNMPSPPKPLDASDALAIALCHQQQSTLTGLQ